MLHYGIIGHPVGHSASAAYFTDKFQREGIEADYQKFDLRPTTFDQRLSTFDLHAFVADNVLSGLNVTIPHKVAVMPYLDALAPSAQRVGAVNVISARDGVLTGHNTDMIGFRDSLAPLLSSRKKAIVLGTGGASKAVEAALRELDVDYILVSRTPQAGQWGYSQITTGIIRERQLIINATPLGMTGDKVDMAPDIPYQAMTTEHMAFDLVYTPDPTLFMKRAMQHGAQAVSGKQMFLNQAKATWNIWQNQ